MAAKDRFLDVVAAAIKMMHNQHRLLDDEKKSIYNYVKKSVASRSRHVNVLKKPGFEYAIYCECVRVHAMHEYLWSSDRLIQYLVRIGSKLLKIRKEGNINKIVGADPFLITYNDLANVGISPAYYPNYWINLTTAVRQVCIGCVSIDNSITDSEATHLRIVRCKVHRCSLWGHRLKFDKITAIKKVHDREENLIIFAIHTQCIKCRFGNKNEIIDCNRILCPFWQFRPIGDIDIAVADDVVRIAKIPYASPPFFANEKSCTMLDEVIVARAAAANPRRISPRSPLMELASGHMIHDLVVKQSDLLYAKNNMLFGVDPRKITPRSLFSAGIAKINFGDAIRENCFSCRNKSRVNVDNCKKVTCPAWTHRTREQKHETITSNQVVKSYCLDCAGSDENVKICAVVSCVFWPLRLAPFSPWEADKLTHDDESLEKVDFSHAAPN